MLFEAGKQSEFSQNDLQKLVVTKNPDGSVAKFPELENGNYVICAFNTYGLPDMATMYVCQNLGDMNKLVERFKNGEAVSMEWFSISSINLRMQASCQLPFFKFSQKSWASMFEETFTEDNRRALH